MIFSKIDPFLRLAIFCIIVTISVGGLFTGCFISSASAINKLISLDDEKYKIEVEEGGELVVRIPEGRPRVPQMSCEGGTIHQAFFADGSHEAVGKVYINDEFHVVRFIKTPELGFELQYDDRYKFIPKKIIPTEFISSNSKVAEVDSLGNVHIVGVSDEEVVITATDGITKEELKITRTIKAPLSVYLVTGQSNASYYYAEPEFATTTKNGTAYHYSELVGGISICSMNNEDGSMARGNVEAAMAKKLYDLLGEKVLLVNAGVSGRKIETFVPIQGESYKYINQVWQIVNRHIQEDSFLKNYEPRIRSYVWLQGESDAKTDVGLYKMDYMKLHNMFVGADYGFDYGFIIKVRDIYVNAAQAQRELAAEYPDIVLGTVAADYCSIQNGKMRNDDLHFSQIGDNLIGEEAAKSIAKAYTDGIESVTGAYQ